ncbi:MAG: YeeE/YedE family protein [Pseudomonadota bacterium]
MRLISAYLIGLVFGAGIALSGMINPAKVLNFFDVAGSWDPSLIFVMGGALLVTFVGYRLVPGREQPLLARRFQVPTNSAIDARLVGGSALFGLGWGIAGFCPGGALPALGTGRSEVMMFVVALIAGMLLTRLAMKMSQRTTNTPSSQHA